MQKCVIKYSENEHASKRDEETAETMPNIPKTSNALAGFYKASYSHLEKATNYVSPKTHLKHKITDSIYSSIIIGWKELLNFYMRNKLHNFLRAEEKFVLFRENLFLNKKV